MGATFAESLRRFEVWMKLQNWSNATRHKYRYELVCFAADDLLIRGLHLTEVTSENVAAYLGSLPPNGTKRGDALRALKAYYRFAELPIDPTANFKIPRAKLSPAPEMEEEEVRRLLRAAFDHPRRGWSMMLALATGARVGSLVAVRRQDVHLKDAWIWFDVAKGGRPYALPLNRRGLIACKHLLSFDHDPIVGVGAARFRQWVHAAEQEAGLERVWPHLFRHTFATHLARTGDVEAWRRGLNHADLSQWPRYVAGKDERLRTAMEGA